MIDELTLEMELGLRASRGAKAMDEIRPGWYLPDQIDLQTFDVRDADRCVLGQVFRHEGGYISNLSSVAEKIDPESSYRDVLASHGFRKGEEKVDAFYGPAMFWTSLTEAWIEEILIRRNTYYRK